MEQAIDQLLNGGQLRKLYEKKAEKIKERYHLRKIDMELLYYLSQGDEEHNTAKDLFERHTFTKGHISQSISRLKLRSMVKVEKDPRDRRKEHILLTEKAQELLEEIRGLHQGLVDTIFTGFTEEERQNLGRIAEKINANIEKELRNGI